MHFLSDPLNFISCIQLFVSYIYIFFLHAYIWSWNIYSSQSAISHGDRVILSIGLSFIITPLLFFLLHRYFNIPLNDVTIYSIISGSNILGLLLISTKYYVSKIRNN